MRLLPSLAFALPLVALTALACDDQEPPVAAVEEPADGDTVVYDTVAFTAADGTVESREVAITLRERRAQEAARAAGRGAPEGELGTVSQAVITSDPACDSASLWVYDGPNQTGKRLCLQNRTTGSTDANLSSFCHTISFSCSLPPFGNCTSSCVATWDNKVLSYWPGAKDGAFFEGDSGGSSGAEYFTNYGPLTNIGINAARVRLTCPLGTGGSPGTEVSPCPG